MDRDTAHEKARLRAWLAHRQALDGTLAGAEPATVLDRTGWARSVGGVNPYLQLRARAGTGRAAADRAAAELALHELPSARGCTYLLPAADFALGLSLSGSAPAAELSVLARLGVGSDEVERLGAAVLAALNAADAPLNPRQLRAELGDQVRSLGEPGRKKGVSTTLPTALGLLQSAGEIRRVPLDGRLDSQRFAYTPWSPSPMAAAPSSPADGRAALAERYWTWTGAASLAHFRWFSGFGKRDTTAATAELGLVPLPTTLSEAPFTELLTRPQDAAAYAEFGAPSEPAPALVGWIDSMTLLHRDLPLLADGPVRTAIREQYSISGLSDLPSQGIVDRGRLIGLWDYDPEAGEIVWTAFGEPASEELHAEIARTTTYLREELGDARGSSLDAPSKRGSRFAAIRALG
jgi:hypothetical protein